MIEGESVWVAGVDGCPSGWLVVMRLLDDPGSASWKIVRSFADVIALEPSQNVIAVDIPIGLPETATMGGRRADVEARRKLGARQSAVFAVPARAAVMLRDYTAACDIALATSDPPRKVSKQIFHLFPKMREVDAIMTRELQARVMECHPELAFWALNGERPVSEPKKVKSRPHAPGLEFRRALLEAAGYKRELLRLSTPTRQAGPDDLLDAAAASWTAARIAKGHATRHPTDPPVDARGLRMEIWA